MLLKRELARLGVDTHHYSISIIRDRGIDRNALRLIAKRHGADAAVFVDGWKARALRERALFQIRQRTTDLLTQMAVSLQGYTALDIIERTNADIIRGIDRASTTTVAALRTAIAVAQALAGQKLVLDRIGAVNASAPAIVQRTALLSPGERNRIVEPSSSSADLAALRRAFAEVRSTLDEVNASPMEACSSLHRPIASLEG